MTKKEEKLFSALEQVSIAISQISKIPGQATAWGGVSSMLKLTLRQAKEMSTDNCLTCEKIGDDKPLCTIQGGLRGILTENDYCSRGSWD